MQHLERQCALKHFPATLLFKYPKIQVINSITNLQYMGEHRT